MYGNGAIFNITYLVGTASSVVCKSVVAFYYTKNKTDIHVVP